MPFPLRIQPIDFAVEEEPAKVEAFKAVAKSRFKRLFERQFSSMLKISAPEKPAGVDEVHSGIKGGGDEFEPSSVCLAKMVQNFIEENNDKLRCSRNRCNCFNGNYTEGSDEESDSFSCFGETSHFHLTDTCDVLKSLVSCVCVSERNLLADTAKIVDKNKINKRKDDFCRKIVTDGLIALGYNASICKSRWEKSPAFPAGEYEYIDVMTGGGRLIIDIDFRSEFEIARSTKAYKSILQTLPTIFVGESDRIQKIVTLVSEAAKQSLKKKGMPFPPWRKADYVKAKWLAPYKRISPAAVPPDSTDENSPAKEIAISKKSSSDEPEVATGGKLLVVDGMFAMSENPGEDSEERTPLMKEWKPPEVRPKSLQKGVKIITGLASVMDDNP